MLLLWLGTLLAPTAWAVDVSGWLYRVEVPVTAQSTSARLEASRSALLTVLSRVTGLASVPRVEVIRGALDAPDLYYSQFGFFTNPDDPDNPSTLR